MADVTVVLADTAPSVFGTLAVAGTAVNLTGATVRFQMRPANDNRLSVNGEAEIVSPTAGTVRYDWAEGDLATPGNYLARWEITHFDETVQHTTPENTISVGLP